VKVTIETSSYNDRRYGKPYIAVIDFSKNPKGDARWGDWVGQPGQPGLLVIEANQGDIIMRGQKDFRNSRHSAPDYYQVGEGGVLDGPITKADAYRRTQVLVG
jgi:hypothetical protein